MGDRTGPKPHERRLRPVFLLWVAILVFGLPEVIAGTGKNWPVRPDVYILALPLYALHFLLICHIAVKTKRTSWSALYLFGVIFGLYETWITKVVWSGYPDAEGFAMGGFGQWFGIHESLGLVLFYHPVTSFLLPLAVVSRLFPAFGRSFPVPDWVFGTTRWGVFRRLGLLVIWGLITGQNMPDPGAYLFSWLSLFAVLWSGYIYLRKRGVTLAGNKAASPLLGRRGFAFASIWLALIYIAAYFLLLPENLPPAHIQFITIGIYLLLGTMLWIMPAASGPYPRETPTAPARLPVRWLLAVFGVGIGVIIVNGLSGTGNLLVLFFGFLPMIPLGVILFIWLGGGGLIAGLRRRAGFGKNRG